MKDRIKMIRKQAKMTQVEFGEKIGVKGNTITGYETGLRTPSDAVIFSMCREFSVNEEWLRNGTEPKYLPASAKFSSYLGEISAGNDYLIQDIIEIYMGLDQQSKDALRVIADKFAEKRIGRKERE